MKDSQLVPDYTLMETSIGDAPAVVIVNSSLLNFAFRDNFPWHLRVGVRCKYQAENGMPTTEELEVLRNLERELECAIEQNGNATFLARITALGERVTLYRVNDPEIADKALQLMLSEPLQVREWEYQIEHDLNWLLAKPELDLLTSRISCGSQKSH